MRIYSLILCLLSLGLSAAQEEDLGRLFFTPEQRQQWSQSPNFDSVSGIISRTNRLIAICQPQRCHTSSLPQLEALSLPAWAKVDALKAPTTSPKPLP